MKPGSVCNVASVVSSGDMKFRVPARSSGRREAQQIHSAAWKRACAMVNHCRENAGPTPCLQRGSQRPPTPQSGVEVVHSVVPQDLKTDLRILLFMRSVVFGGAGKGGLVLFQKQHPCMVYLQGFHVQQFPLQFRTAENCLRSSPR